MNDNHYRKRQEKERNLLTFRTLSLLKLLLNVCIVYLSSNFTYPFISFRIQGEHGEASDAEGAAQVSAGRLATFLTIS